MIAKGLDYLTLVNQQALPHIDIIDMREEFVKVIVPCFL